MAICRAKSGNTQLISVVMFTVVGLICLAIFLPIGLKVNHDVSGIVAPDTTWTTTENDTLDAVTTNVQSGFSMMSVSPTILVATGLISIIFAGFGAFLYMRGRE